MQNFLSDDWSVGGTSYTEFKENIHRFSNQTRIVEKEMDEFSFLNVSDFGDGNEILPLSGDPVWKSTNASLIFSKISIGDLPASVKYDEVVMREAIDNGLFVMFPNARVSIKRTAELFKNEECIPVSAIALSSISRRVSISGNSFMKPGLLRDLMIAEYFSKSVSVKAVERIDSDSGSRKIFAVMSSDYAHIPQESIITIVEGILLAAKRDLGMGICSNWSISHTFTSLHIEFPESAKELANEYKLPAEIVPGILIETSDIGECSLRIKGYFKLNGIFNYMEHEYTQVHKGNLNYDEMLKEVEKRIFPEYRIYPEKLATLMMIDLTDSAMTEPEKIVVMSDLYEDVTDTIKLVKIIHKTRKKAFLEQLTAEINPDLNYTAYDVAERFLTLPNTIEIQDRAMMKSISKAVKKVLDYDFSKSEILFI